MPYAARDRAIRSQGSRYVRKGPISPEDNGRRNLKPVNLEAMKRKAFEINVTWFRLTYGNIYGFIWNEYTEGAIEDCKRWYMSGKQVYFTLKIWSILDFFLINKSLRITAHNIVCLIRNYVRVLKYCLRHYQFYNTTWLTIEKSNVYIFCFVNYINLNLIFTSYLNHLYSKCF